MTIREEKFQVGDIVRGSETYNLRILKVHTDRTGTTLYDVTASETSIEKAYHTNKIGNTGQLLISFTLVFRGPRDNLYDE
jgi:hypothetical protein